MGDDVPIGALKCDGWCNTREAGYVAMINNGWPSPIKSSDQVPSATDVYRRVLAAQPDHSVHIASVGMLTNLKNLFQSGPDHHSALNGLALFTQKVRLIGIMAGQYPSGGECNMRGDPLASQYVVNRLPSTTYAFFLGSQRGHHGLHGCGPHRLL